MAFDPDAYLAAKTAPAPAFDPDAYLAQKVQPPRNVDVASTAINRGLSNVADAFLNAPTNIANLGIAGVGSALTAAGRPDLAPDPLQPPNLAQRGMGAMGIETAPPAGMTPGQRIASQGLEYGASAIAGPAATGRQLAANIALGGVSGTAGGAVEQVTGSPEAGFAASLVAPIAVGAAAQSGARRMAMNASKDAVAREARRAGFVIPPSMTGASLPARAVEGASGRLTMNQTASRRNEEAAQRLAARAVGLPEDQLNAAGLAQVRNEANRAYQAIESQPPFAVDAAFRQDLQRLGAANRMMGQNVPALAQTRIDDVLGDMAQNQQFDAPAAIQIIRRLRSDASKLYAQTDAPGSEEVARAVRGASDALENLIERRLSATAPDLVPQFQQARQRLATAHSVEDAMNAGNGQINPQALARMLENGEPLSGDLLTIARAASAFPKALQKPSGEGQYPVSKLDYGFALGGGALGTMGAIEPTTAAMAAFAPTIARNTMLSQPYQRMVAPNNYLFTRAAQNANPLGVMATNALAPHNQNALAR